MNIFIQKKYRDIIKNYINSNNSKGYQGVLAKQAGCSKSYLSQILNSNVHLTLDQGANLAIFWGFNNNEIEYFLTLIEYERSGSQNLKKYLEEKMKYLRKKNKHFKRFYESSNNKKIMNNNLLYYSSWMYSAIHVIMNIAKYNSTQTISDKLNIPTEIVHQILINLKEMNLIQQISNGKWSSTNNNLHLSSDSPLTPIAHQSWRNKVITHIQRPTNKGLHYSGVHTVSLQQKKEIKEQVVEFIVNIRSQLMDGIEEDIIGFNMDFYDL